MKFHENLSSGSGQTDRQTDGRIDRQKDRHDEANLMFF